MRWTVAIAAVVLLGTGWAAAGPPVAVLELFTSEGCSSCPPAEAVLAKVLAEADARGEEVEALEWHVTYWNHLGWRDRYSLPEADARQHRLAAARGEGGAFTPEAVVDGRVSLVGSDAAHLRAALREASARPRVVLPRLEVELSPSGHRVTVRVGGNLPRNAELLVAVVEDGLASWVTRGENARRTLRHLKVVRAARQTRVEDLTSGGLALELPVGLDPAHAQAVVVLSDTADLTVVGAAHHPLR